MGRTALSVVVVTVATALLASEVHAGWGSWGASYGGSVGAWGSHGSWGGSVGYASGGSWGGRRHAGGRLHARWAAHRARKLARRASYYASGGSWGGSSGSYASGGSWGSSGGSWGASYGSTGYARAGYGSTGYASSGYASAGYGSTGYASSGSVGGSVGSWPSSDGVIIDEGTEVETQPLEDASASRRSSDQGVLTVSVPSDARIFVNGSPTRTTGNERRYVSHGLAAGHDYRYEVRAIVERDGQTQEQTRVAMLRAGRKARLDFDFTQPEPVETRLTLHVPKDAQVRLSGSETQSTGPVRHFATTRIESGQQWADYVVEVSLERNGRLRTKQQRVSLSGGDQKELSFNFDETELAAAR